MWISLFFNCCLEKEIKGRGGIHLQRFFSTFPDGPPGYGLLLFRSGLGCMLVAYGIVGLRIEGGLSGFYLIAWPAAIFSGSLMILGFLTPMISALVSIGGIAGVALYLFTEINSLSNAGVMAMFTAISSSAILLLGPGAISVDAKLFGRREIIIPHKRRDEASSTN